MSNKKTRTEPVADQDNPEWTEAEIKSAKPGAEFFKQLGIEPPRPRGRPKLDTPKQQVTLRLDADLLKELRASGKGWQSRVNDILRNEVMG